MGLLPVDGATAPFWLSDPHPLASFRSSETPPEEVDIAIIGTGLAGVSTAYHILKSCDAGARPTLTLLEARQACSGATGRNGGHVKVGLPGIKRWHELHGPETAAELIAWVGAQRRGIKRTAEEEELDCELLVTRTYDVFYDATHAAVMKKWLLEQRQRGAAWLDDVQWLEGPHLDKITGTRGGVAAFSVPAISLWPYKFVTGLLARVLDLGATLYTETPVEAVDGGSGSGPVKLSTPRGLIKAKKVIYATNGYSAAILPQYRGVVVPIRGQAAHLVPNERTHHCPNLATTFNLFHTSEFVDYLNPRLDGTIVLGGGKRKYRQRLHDRNETWFNNVDDASLINDAVRSDFEETVNGKLYGWEKSEARADMTWTGIMGSTVDGLPHAGQVPGTHNQWILAGFNGGGMAMIFTLARGIADMVVSGTAFEQTDIPAVFKSTRERIADNKYPELE